MPPEHKARLPCLRRVAKGGLGAGLGSAVSRRERMGPRLNHSTENQEVSV